jgi:hypothetical protein
LAYSVLILKAYRGELHQGRTLLKIGSVSMTHHHDREIQSLLSFDEKMIKLIEHWIKHNDVHAQTYRDWAQKAKEKNKNKTALVLEDVAEMTLSISKKFELAIKYIDEAKEL